MFKEDTSIIPLRPISDFISVAQRDGADGRDSHFFIPSYQRGYRWEAEDVKYLLDDILDFIEEEGNTLVRPYYCLQPVVVKKRTFQDSNGTPVDGWEVIDGQQRLTTLRLVLEELKKNSDYSEEQLYTIAYETRPALDIDEIDALADIDSFYMAQAKRVIQEWIADFKRNRHKYAHDLNDMRKCLFMSGKGRSVKVIWYEEPSDEKLDSIKTFNNLNKGKIRLTSSELIKACFLLHYSDSPGMCDEIASEWYRMETALQRESFWRFLTNNDYSPSTHIDLIFDFLVDKPQEEDNDYAYRKFKYLFEGKDTVMGYNADTVWDAIKRIFGTFQYWYEDDNIYHYIGFLVASGIHLKEIYSLTENRRKDEMLDALHDRIRELLNINEESLRNLKYGNANVRRVLMLFCIETMAAMSCSRFDFASFKQGSRYDVEHISSKTTNNLQRTEERIMWIGYLKDLTEQMPKDKLDEWNDVLDKAASLLEKMENGIETGRDDFNELYSKAVEMADCSDLSDDDKDCLWNLTLLDSHTNRSYGNALFPTKRKTIIEREQAGTFIPMTTRNVFLKYYSKDEGSTMQWHHIWNREDALSYLDCIVDTLGTYLK